ncbi:MAG: hypothetical protein F4137_09045 [Acidobacteria bacterium]|nr:hypothetical protein [Acidobacteriota bacterium]MYH28983.1 hypothetical protein [Acidobacteriota bacterium]
MVHPGLSADFRARRRLVAAALRGTVGDRNVASLHARTLAADALEEAAGLLRERGRDGRVRALVNRAIRRAGLAADLED